MRTIPVGKYEVIVDDWNYERVRGLRMNASGKNASSGSVKVYWNQHARRTGPDNKRESIPLSKILLLTDAPTVDHKDRNWLNHQVDNLRPCTRSQNQANRPKEQRTRPASSHYKGVNWSKQRNKWRARVVKQRKEYHAGFFLNEEDAARAYDVKAREHFGEFALLNFP